MLSPTEISAGWLSLKGVGPSKAQAIEEYLEHNQIRKVDDLLNVRGIGPGILAKMRSQLEGDDPFGLRRIERALDEVRRDIKARRIPLAYPNATSDQIMDWDPEREVIWMGVVKLKEFKDYVEDERSRTGRDPEEIRREMWRPDLPTSCFLHANDDGDEDIYLRIKRQHYPRFKPAIERLRVDLDVVWVRARKSRNSFGAALYVDELVIIQTDVM